jgi:hypothetical protein
LFHAYFEHLSAYIKDTNFALVSNIYKSLHSLAGKTGWRIAT